MLDFLFVDFGFYSFKYIFLTIIFILNIFMLIQSILFSFEQFVSTAEDLKARQKFLTFSGSWLISE